jgi:hypothetical protein
MTMTMANMDGFCRSHNWAVEVGKRVGVTVTTAMMPSSGGELPGGSNENDG